MNYSEFFKAFYFPRTKGAIVKYKSMTKIPDFFFANATNNNEDDVLPASESEYEKYLKGTRSPSPEIWDSVIKHLSEPAGEAALSRALVRNLNDDLLSQVVDRLGLILSEDESLDKEMFAIAVTRQFLKIAQGNGEAENIVETVYREDVKTDSFPVYVRESLRKYEKMKTLLYTSEEHPFDEFFVCNTISRDGMLFRRHRVSPENCISNADLDQLRRVAMYALLVGMGGMGKSMMMRHLFLEAIRKYDKTGRLPILVTLREFSQNAGDVFELILRSVNRFDMSFTSAHLHKMMLKGKCQILLDGLDEIKYTEIEEFEIQLDRLIDRYPNNQFVMSTRRFSTFVEISRFTVLQMQPFSLEQSIELIDKLDFCPEEPKLKAEFREKTINEYSKTHKEFISNPLLLTLMLMNFRRFSDVPEKKYLFYQQAYDTLLYRHDADKLAYRRVFKSVNDPSEFTDVFREFCARSYRHGQYEFTDEEFAYYFNQLHTVKELNSPMMTVDNFLYDILHSVCLMYEEAQSYHFLHRSFQEYFFAEYYSRQDDTTLKRLGKALGKAQTNIFNGDVGLEMLYELAPQKVDRFILQPFLERIFENASEEKSYELFLTDGFGSIDFSWLDRDKIKEYETENTVRAVPGWINEPTNILMGFILSTHANRPFFNLVTNQRVNIKDGGDKWIIYGSIIENRDHSHKLFRLRQMPIDFWERDEYHRAFGKREGVVLDEEDKPRVFGEEYVVSCKNLFSDKERYKAVIDLLKDPKQQAYQLFLVAGRFYKDLKEKYAGIDELEDDDF